MIGRNKAHRKTARWKHDCPAAHGQDKCFYDARWVTSGMRWWIPASDRRRLDAARYEMAVQ